MPGKLRLPRYCLLYCATTTKSSSFFTPCHCLMKSPAQLFTLFCIALFLINPSEVQAQETEPVYDPALYQALAWRNIGPYRGGRSTAVAGVSQHPYTFYMGTTGGGLWKTEDAGLTWKNISDGFFKTGSVGAIAVAPSDPNVVYVGMGEAPVRGVMTTHGDGVYKSTDAGRTWAHLGLEKTRHISAIRVHSQNPDVVFIGAQGLLWGPNPERGVYRSTNGGADWDLVHHVDERTGVSDLSMDPTNPRILYAGYWEHQRTPWTVISGGPGSGIYTSTNGGDTWAEITEGLPDLMGKIGVAVSPAQPDRIWALIEAEEGGLFRSDDAGKSWKRVNKARVLRARAWYYTHITADPVDPHTVYVMNAPLLRSIDGGATFKPVPTPHGDNHAIWINPDNNQIMINANDGGANVSTNGGATWSTQANQPTAQFYRVITDRQFPYRVYGGQQDNSSVSIASRSNGSGIGRADWYPVGGCESAFPAFDPDNPVLVYAGCYQGQISEYNHATRQSRAIMAYPYLGLSLDAKDVKYRFNWNAPILASKHDPSIIYHAGNVLFKTTDRGHAWQPISPDLTRNEIEKQGPGGRPITNEAAGAEVYNTILYVAESPHAAGTLWVGTDDGLVHLTQDEGETWINITPPGIGEVMINAIDASAHDPATAYLAVTGYKSGDFAPHIFKTTDFGETWTKLINGLPDEAYVRVVREDPVRQGLLYAGTEAGLFISFNGGAVWQPFQNDLPLVPITDLIVHEDDLVAATHGRSFWILDDLAAVRQLTDAIAQAPAHLFAPGVTYWMNGGGRGGAHQGKNPPNGVTLYYTLAEPDSATVVQLDMLDATGTLIRSVRSDAKVTPPRPGGPPPAPKVTVEQGMNRFVWDMHHTPITAVPELFTYGSLAGRHVMPGTYQARLIVGADTVAQAFEIRLDPRLERTPEDLLEQADLLAQVQGRAEEIHKAVNTMRSVGQQVKALLKKADGHEGADTLATVGKALLKDMDTWESELVQVRQETFQDVINFPNKLNAQYIYMLSAAAGAASPVTAGTRARLADLDAQWAVHKAEMERMLQEVVPAFDALYQAQRIPAITIPENE